MKIKTGKVYIIGGGPGDPGLITVKGLDALRKADCVLYDFLSAPELLLNTKKKCQKICVGKSDKVHLWPQESINSLLYEKAVRHKVVVRLKGGDPFVFSRGWEEASYLRKKGVETEVIPGVTSATAGPLSFGIPLTIKDRVTSLAIVTGRKKDPEAPIEAPKCGTLVYLMAVANIANVVNALKKSGRKAKTPCAFIERSTLDGARIVYATLATLEKTSRKKKIKPPAVLIVGEAVKYGN